MPGTRGEIIRKRAFAIWEHADRQEGKELDHWLRAEAEIDGSTALHKSMNTLREDNMDEEIKRRFDVLDKQISNNTSYILPIRLKQVWPVLAMMLAGCNGEVRSRMLTPEQLQTEMSRPEGVRGVFGYYNKSVVEVDQLKRLG